MPFPIPHSLSPSRVEAFTSCPLQFRFTAIEKLPEPPSVHAVKGSLVHRALQLLFLEPPVRRTPPTAAQCLAQALEEFTTSDAEFAQLALDDEARREFTADSAALVERYFSVEDPRAVRDIGLELRLEASVGALALRGIIDRLELDECGDLVVTDYKTGRAPGRDREQSRLGGLNFYALLCEHVLGRRPALIRLLYLRSGETISATPSEQSVRFLQRRTEAVFQAVEKACTTGDFRPRPSALCQFCAFQAYCPAFGGNPDLAAAELLGAPGIPARPNDAPAPLVAR